MSSPTKYVVPCYQCATEILNNAIEDTKSGGAVWHTATVKAQSTDCIVRGCAVCDDGSYEPILELSIGVNIAKLSVVHAAINGLHYVTVGAPYKEDFSGKDPLARKFRTLIDLVDKDDSTTDKFFNMHNYYKSMRSKMSHQTFIDSADLYQKRCAAGLGVGWQDVSCGWYRRT